MDNYKKAEDKFLFSSYIAKMVEHLFITDILKEAWLRDHQIEILRAEIDNSGYDLVLECSGCIRHVQLKCSHQGSKTKSQKVNTELSKKPSGCVIWIKHNIGKQKKEIILKYKYFGDNSCGELPSLDNYKTAKKTTKDKGGIKKQRKNIKVVPESEFKHKSTIELINILFGLDLNED
jgi:hypothetical protein